MNNIYSHIHVGITDIDIMLDWFRQNGAAGCFNKGKGRRLLVDVLWWRSVCDQSIRSQNRDASDRVHDKAIVNPMFEMVTIPDDNVNGHDIAERVHDDDPIASNDVRISDFFRYNTS